MLKKRKILLLSLTAMLAAPALTLNADDGCPKVRIGGYRVWIPKTLHVMSEPYHRY